MSHCAKIKVLAGLCSFWDFPGGSVVKNLPAVQETWVPSLVGRDPLEKGMAVHSSILAWRIPWTEESGGLRENPFSCPFQLLESATFLGSWPLPFSKTAIASEVFLTSYYLTLLHANSFLTSIFKYPSDYTGLTCIIQHTSPILKSVD